MSLFGPPDAEKLLAKGDADGLVKLLGYRKDWEVRRSAALGRDFEAAAQAYRQAIESAPYEDEILYMSLGGVLSELRRHAQALANLEVAAQINPASDDVVRNLAICRANVDAGATS